MARVLAVDLGAYAVKVTELKTSGRRGFELVGRYVMRVPQDGSAPTRGQKLAALDALLDEHPAWAGAYVLASWPGEAATLHRMTLPFTDRAKVDQTLPFAVEAEVPFDLEDMVLNWRLKTVGETTEALVALAKHADVEEALGDLAERGLDPAGLYIDGDTASYWTPDEDTVTAVLDIGHTHTVVSVVRGGHVEITRAINVGGQKFTAAIQHALDVTWTEAEAIKHGQAIDEAGDDEDVTDPGFGARSGYSRLAPGPRAAVDAQVGLLLAEVRSTLIHAEDELGLEIDEIRVCGGSARIHELWDYLQQDLGVPVRQCVDPDGDPVPGPFGVCHVLAMKAVGAYDGDQIDLRVEDLSFKGGTDIIRAVFTYGGAGLAFFTVAALVMFVVQYRSLMVEHNTTLDQMVQVVDQTWGPAPDSVKESQIKMLSLAIGETQDAVTRAEVLREGQGGVPPVTDTLHDITQAFPPHPTVTVDVTSMTITQNDIKFTAETDGYASSSAVESELKKNEIFKHAKKVDRPRTPKGRLVFDISIPLNDGSDAADGAAGEDG